MDGTSNSCRISRRRLLGLASATVATPFLTGFMRFRSEQAIVDSDGDGIPDRAKRSNELGATLNDIFGEQFAGLALGRRDLLLDVRYIGSVTVPLQVKRAIVRRFRNNGIQLQWLDYPERYDLDWFNGRYGNNARKILWGRDSFYRNEIEDELKNTALQLVMVPGALSGPYQGRIYSPWADLSGSHSHGYINGMNFGNRAVAAERHPPWEQARLIFHEIAHLALCHDQDPMNRGVMGTNETLTLMDDEWLRLREHLDNVRDTTGYDLLLRRCLWLDREQAGQLIDCQTCMANG